ncbi:MAG: tail fiber domain-containing protein, partial [Salibacteraceae bacterium]
MKKYFRFSAAILIAAALLLTDSVLGQALFTPSGGTSTGAAGTLGIGIDADPALAPLDIVGNNVLIRPSTNFNPNGKFIGLGQSGGVLGPINGCDLYGFRAQRNQNTNFIGEAFINVGIRQIPLAEPGFDFNGNNFPTVSWGGFTEVVPGKPFLNNLDFLNDNSDDNCGDIVARMSPMNSPYQFTVFGDALVTGTLFQNSNVRYKQNIQPIGNAMDLIAQLQGSTYTMNQEAFPEMNFKDGTQYGFIAQHVEEVIPEMVQANGEGFLSVNYTAMVPLLVEGLKEQQDVVEGQKEVIEAQSQELEVQGQELAAAKLANAAMNSQLQEQQA